MKLSTLLIAASLPLAAATALNLVEMVSVEPRAPIEPAEAARQAASEAAAALRARPESERRALAAVAGADLLSAPPLDELASSDSEQIEALAAAWAGWRGALQTARDVADALRPTALGDLEGLKQAAAKLASLKARAQASSLPARDQLQRALGRRLDDLQARIARVERERQAADRLARADSAFKAAQHGPCVALCNELLTSFADVLDAPAADGVRRLRARAEFWDANARTAADLATAVTPADRRLVLQKFLDKYPDRAHLTASEREVLDRMDRDVQAMTAQMQAAQTDLGAAEAIAALRAALPAALSQRTRRAAEILDRFPTEASRAALRREVRAWLAELLPEKQIQESPQLQEVETARHEIVRGFFTEVRAPHGYKCYPTYEQSIKPVSDVGTYLAQELLGGPAPSVPRRCVTRYNKARAALIESPASKDAWQQLAGLCGQLDEELQKYTRKPGSSREPLSFAQEAAFVRSQLEAASWANLEKLLGP